ncbi:MAG: alginate lyase family protein [Acidobacteria bacterium]|nr:alginate lyase family protein [Acidobacteriota bacterium]MBI3422770.1 alginate lyase family protein [Acidobacteriota bacterium]
MKRSKLDKLRGMSPHEWRTRSAQELAKLSERYLGRGTRELTDSEFLREWQAPADARPVNTAQAAAADLLKRLQQRPRFFPALSQRTTVVQTLQTRFAAECEQLLARADRVLANRFDIFACCGEHAGLSFGEPVNWRLEPSSGKATPLAHWSAIDFLNPAVAGDKKFTWELNRCQFFITLGQAYWLTGDEKYAEQFVALTTAWLDANPPKRGINWASSLELSFRVIAWLWALHLFADAKALTPEFTTRVLKSLLAQGRHIETYLSLYFSPNTHLTGEALGLFYLGVALPELCRAEHWRQLGLRILLEQLPVHVRRDGVYFEQASYYHRYTADFYTHLLLLSRASDTALPPLVEEKLIGLHEHLLWLTRPDGTSPFYGDDDGGRTVMLSTRRADDFRDTLATGAALLQRPDWKFVAGEAAVETLWLLGADGLRTFDELAAHAPTARHKAFADSGAYVMRDGWTPDASYLFIDCGPHGVSNGGHAHSDALSFEFAAGGATWLVDPGTFSYTGDLQQRNEIRCSQNHNTVSVDGLSQSTPQTAFTWAQTARCLPREFRASDEGLFFAGQQDGYTRLADPVRQQRAWLLHPAEAGAPLYLLMTDRLEAQGAHQYQWHFHFAAGCRTRLDGNLVRVVAATGQELWLAARVTGDNELHFAVTEGWVSRCYGQREAAPTVTISTVGRGGLTVETLLVPLADKQAEEFVREWPTRIH